jgi:Tfp pilus assembly major pilin PilA
MHKAIFFISFIGLAACSKDVPSGSASTTNATTTAAAAAPKATDKNVDLTPLPLTVKMPSEEMALAMDMSMGDIKSVSVSYEAINAGLNVSVPSQKSFAEVKKEYKGDTILFPFKRWVRESDTSAVEEFTNEGKSGFMGLSWRDVGGKKYLCKSNGLSGLKTAEDAEKAIKTCETLAAK